MKFYIDTQTSTNTTAETLTQTEKYYRRPLNASKTDVLQSWHTDPMDQAGKWTVKIPGITQESLVDGLTIRIRLSTSYATNQGYNTLNINGLGPKLVYYRYNEFLKNHVPQWAEIVLIYHKAHTMVSAVNNQTYSIYGCRPSDYTPTDGYYANQNLGSDGWILDTAYSDGNNYERLLNAYEARTAGANVYPHTLCMIDVNGKIRSIVTTESESSGKVADTTPFRPYRILYYAGSETITSGNPVTDLYEDVPIESMNATLNSSMTAYSDLYLKGTIDDQGFFILDSTNYYVAVPHSIAVPANTFEQDKYYIFVGASDGTTGHMQLLPSHPFFYCDDNTGSSLRPTSLARDDVDASRIVGILPIAHGGTGLDASPSMLVNLESSDPDDILKASPTPGISGVLGVAHGGTGKSTWTAGTFVYASAAGTLASTTGLYTDGSTLTVTGIATFNGNVAMNSSAEISALTAGSLIVSGNTSLINTTNTSSILPHATDIYSIGSATLKYENVYANHFKGNADSADAFAFDASIILQGDVTGSASSTRDWTITTAIGAGVVTNTMLAGSIANGKLVNSSVTIAGNSVSLGGSLSAATLLSSLGLSNAMHFIGHATVDISDGSTTDPVIANYTFANAKAGDVIIDGHDAREYVWSAAGKWELLGGDSSYKILQTAVSAPTEVTNKWVSTIGQDENGDVTVTYAELDTSGTWTGTATYATNDSAGNNIVNTYLQKTVGVTEVAWDYANKKITQTINGSTLNILEFVADSNITLTAESGKLKIKSSYTNSRDPGYGKISLAGDTGEGTVTADTNQLAAKTYNEAFTFKTGNKWLIVSGSNSATAGSDVLLIGHSLSGVTSGNYGDSNNQDPGYGGTFKVPYISVDKAGHITSISEHTVTIPSSDQSDENVKQSDSTETTWKKVLLHYQTDTTTTANVTETTNQVYASKYVAVSPAEGKLRATEYNVDDHCRIHYDSATQALQFIFE